MRDQPPGDDARDTVPDAAQEIPSMFRRIAVLADIHGNLPALEAVLAEVERLGVDRLVLNGDIAGGPLAGETLDRLADLGERAIWVHGNGERGLVAGFHRADDPTANRHDLEVGRLLSRDQCDRLTGLPMTVTLEVAGLGTALCCHATPRRDDEMLLVDSPPSRYAEALAGVRADVVVLGHTHMPFDRLHDRRRVVNPGSVGMPYGHAGAAWALLGPGVELRRTPYDAVAAAARLAASAWSQAAWWAETYVLRQASDVEALDTFTQIARDQQRTP
jgi:putative phosphoesterase